jgi:hypothetical protein
VNDSVTVLVGPALVTKVVVRRTVDGPVVLGFVTVSGLIMEVATRVVGVSGLVVMTVKKMVEVRAGGVSTTNLDTRWR